MAEIEYDLNKRATTLEERGLDFEDAPLLFAQAHISREDARQDYGETRIITVGTLHHRMVVMVWTWRDTKRRIISMRYANEREQRRFHPYLG
ncbi:BrnT family toxin [Halomonas litopenaei]|uniref:BrnT family toxin n=1 Tax=Halomonas litopenaei TaxID=2109328 RepID=A0ABX5IWF4_9GAMM|nr:MULTISPECIES: BrnT family toxin [Halomonas]MBS8269496.1 BrnT family toxin [Halomonas litopenaei]PTL89120.1 BrnT family toxin [Halomonas sp. SYSU XM8]PTL94932.1 BrnT family toxin [Halomonas litopenaei]